MADLGQPGGAGRGEKRRLGAGHRRFVEVDRRRLQAVRRLEHVAGARRPARAPIAASASRCVDDRAARGKIAARRRQPRAPAPRQQRAEEQHRAAQAADERAVRLVLRDLRAAHAQRRACRCPRPAAPRSISSRAITSTSLMRGTLVSTHSSVVSRQAASSGSAVFLLPSTSTAPDRRWPPSISKCRHESVVVSVSVPATQLLSSSGSAGRHRSRRDRRSLPAARRRSARARRPGTGRSAGGCRAPSRVPSLTMKLPCVGETRAPPMATPFRPARSTSAPADHGMPSGHARRGPAPGSERCSRRLACRAAASACETPATRAPSRAAPPARRRETRKTADRRTSPVSLQPAAIVPERHRRARRHRSIAPSRDGEPHLGDEIADETAAEMRVAEDARRRPSPACPPRLRGRRGRD